MVFESENAEEKFDETLQNVYTQSEAYKEANIDNKFDFDVAGQCIAIKFKIKMVNYSKFKQDTKIGWRTKYMIFKSLKTQNMKCIIVFKYKKEKNQVFNQLYRGHYNKVHD